MTLQKDEAERIYYALFRKKIPESIQYHFEKLSKKLEDVYSEEEIKKYYECIAKINDLEALELAARYLKKFTMLTKKFQIMIYLSETLPENYVMYINEKNNRFFGCLLLMTSTFRTLYKFVLGIFFLTVYRP